MLNIIKRLSYDKVFGILTRPALEIILENKKSFDCCLIDFNNLKKLNKLIGYNQVNSIIFNLFKEYKQYNNSIIGRWFSGDEILIVDNLIRLKICILKKIAYKHGMSFKTFYFENKNLKQIEIEIDKINYNYVKI